MSYDPAELVVCISAETSKELEDALKKIRHCVMQLSDEQLWWRPAESMNSIANLMLHLCGNLHQWIVAGVGGTPDHRERQSEFDDRGPIPADQLMQRLQRAVTEATSVLGGLSAEALLAPRRVQGFDVTGAEAIIHSVAHFRGHAQEIVHMTRIQLEDAYRFDFVPSTPEQGA